MSNVWLCLPSKRPFEQVDPVLKLWRERGYRVAIQRDDTEPHSFGTRGEWKATELVVWGPYGGYATAVNTLTREVLSIDKQAQWIVCAGDDTEPDLNHEAEEIAQECSAYFFGHNCSIQTSLGAPVPPTIPIGAMPTYGVMQPTGDRWGDRQGAYIDRVAGSPWMGREFCLRVNQGRGPLWSEYFHCFADEELQHVATRLGVFWQRPDLIHMHQHWGRVPNGAPFASSSLMPDFLKRANSSEEWRKASSLFKQRKATNFPGSEPL